MKAKTEIQMIITPAYKINIIAMFCLLVCIYSSAQTSTPWHQKKCAVVLTYDDALNVHLDNVVPLLDSLKLKATFYVTTYFPGFSRRVSDWKKVAAKGYELGNHTLFHPCTGNTPGREWVKPDYNLATYSLQRMRDEISMNNIFLSAMDGKTKRTFAYPCGDTRIGDSLYLDKNSCVAARTVQPQMPHINEVDLYNVGCYGINGQSGEELVALVKQAMEKGSLLVFLFHGVGGEHSLNVSLEAHRTLLYFLKQHEKDIWIAPMIDVAEYISQYRQTHQ